MEEHNLNTAFQLRFTFPIVNSLFGLIKKLFIKDFVKKDYFFIFILFFTSKI